MEGAKVYHKVSAILGRCVESVVFVAFIDLTIMSGYSHFNSSPPSAAYMRQWIGSALVRVMACRLFGAKPLTEPMLTYRQLDH